MVNVSIFRPSVYVCELHASELRHIGRLTGSGQSSIQLVFLTINHPFSWFRPVFIHFDQDELSVVFRFLSALRVFRLFPVFWIAQRVSPEGESDLHRVYLHAVTLFTLNSKAARGPRRSVVFDLDRR